MSLTQSGVYKDTLTSSSGCDSIITLNLSVNPITTTSISDVICIGNIYNFNGRILTSPGVYSDTLPSVIGCDSIIVLTLNNSATTPPTVALSTQTTSICTNQLVTVTAMVQNNSGSISYQWYLNGSLIFNPGATFSTTSFNSNDSIRVVVLTSDGCGNSKAIISNTIVFTVQTILAKPIISVSDSIICAGDSVLLSTVQSYSAYLWSNGDTTSSTTVKAAGPHSVQVFSACASATSDPVILKMSSLQQPSVLQASNDSLYSSIAGVSYQWYFNNTFVLGATQSSVIASQNGDYAVEVRDNLGCSSRSANYNFVRTGINKVMDFKLNVYPNPTSSLLSVETNVKVDIIVVYDVIGSVVARIQNPMLKQDIDFSLFASGMYNIVVHRDGIMQNVKVLKE
ncbi:MAG: T9SS type A sorting domain-containing protein [Chitinophagales bacterium]|nr:T9SS type A sorting domain-containing protein [Chitinophagales bacterium]